MLVGIALCSCNNRTENSDYGDFDTRDTLTHHARFLTIVDCGGGLTRVDIADPWNSGGLLAQYALVDKDSMLPDNLSPDLTVVRTPVERMAVFSSVHTKALEELGGLDAVAAVADRQYFASDDTITYMLADGRIADLGQSNSPSVELLAANKIEVVLRSPMQGISQAKYPAGTIAVECADYMETSPIGRAEWILLLGELTGRRSEAIALLDSVIDNYASLVFEVSKATSPRPKILADTEYSGTWYVAQGDSYMARLYHDAGGDWPWADSSGSGSLSLSLEDVATKAMDADIWLIRSYGYETTPETLKAMNPRYSSFKPLISGKIYSCNTAERNIFNDAAFHPDKVLAEYIAIFHPDVMQDYNLQYFIRTK